MRKLQTYKATTKPVIFCEFWRMVPKTGTILRFCENVFNKTVSVSRYLVKARHVPTTKPETLFCNFLKTVQQNRYYFRVICRISVSTLPLFLREREKGSTKQVLFFEKLYFMFLFVDLLFSWFSIFMIEVRFLWFTSTPERETNCSKYI